MLYCATILTFYILCLFFDLKYREIPNLLFLVFGFIGASLLFLNFLQGSHDLVSFVIQKILYSLLTFSISLTLFLLKIIGGADGKLILITFLIIPIGSIKIAAIFLYFFFFIIAFLVMLLSNYTKNRFNTSNRSFDIIFMTNKEISRLEKVFIKSFYSFSEFKNMDVYEQSKLRLASIDLIFNWKRGNLLILTQNRPPLVLAFFISFNFLILIDLIL